MDRDTLLGRRERRLIYINAPHFFAGLIVQNNKVIEAAPIIKYMRGWSQHAIKVYCQHKGWEVRRVE